MTVRDRRSAAMIPFSLPCISTTSPDSIAIRHDFYSAVSKSYLLMPGGGRLSVIGGLMILAGAVISTLLWANLENGYVWVVLFVTICFGGIGFGRVLEVLSCALLHDFHVVEEAPLFVVPALQFITELLLPFRPCFGKRRVRATVDPGP